MDDPPRRRFTLADLLILIAAAGLSFAMTRAMMVRQASGGPSGMATEIYAGACWLAVALTVALIPIRLRRPRPSWEALRDRPGFIAPIAVLLAVSLELLGALPLWLTGIYNSWRFSAPHAMNVAPLVAVAWLVLKIGGRWEPGTDWVDRAGLALGVLWLVGFAATSIGIPLMM